MDSTRDLFAFVTDGNEEKKGTSVPSDSEQESREDPENQLDGLDDFQGISVEEFITEMEAQRKTARAEKFANWVIESRPLTSVQGQRVYTPAIQQRES